jgi:hypothetical protein
MERNPMTLTTKSCQLFVLVATFWLCNPGIRAQGVDPKTFFPHHLGDTWEYIAYSFGVAQDTIESVVTVDSVGPDGRSYVYITSSGHYIIDSSSQVFFWDGDRELREFDLTAEVGARWSLVIYGGVEVLYKRVDRIYSTVVFGKAVTAKVYDTWYKGSASDSFIMNSSHLASGFGEVLSTAEIGDVTILRGAIIDGVRYGSLTSVKPVDVLLPGSLNLYQNYPNPFNPSTTIEFDLPHDAIVRLKVFNLLGGEVVTLAESNELAGTHKVVWNGRDRNGNPVSSGVYFYSLETGQRSITRKLIILR